MATEQQNQLFYFQQDPEDLDIQEDDAVLSLAPTPATETESKPNPKQFYKIEDINRLSVNFFQRQGKSQEVRKDIVLTNYTKRGSKEIKLSIDPMGVIKESDKKQEERKRRDQKPKTTIFWEEEIENQEKLEGENKIGQPDPDSEDDIQVITFNESLPTKPEQEISFTQPPSLPSNNSINSNQQLSSNPNDDQSTPASSVESSYKSKTEIEVKMIIHPSEIQNILTFIHQPVEKGKVLQCTIKRDREGINRLFPQFYLYTTQGVRFLMGAKKRSGNATSNYLISTNRNDLISKGDNYIGKVRSNWMGTEFIGYDAGCNPDKEESNKQQRKQLCEIYYQSNFMGTKGPRVMDIYIPKYAGGYHRDTSLKQLHKKNQSIRFSNKRPKWSTETKTFVLNFGTRVQKASVKNFILVQNDKLLQDKYSMLFGKVNSDVYNMDVKYPFTPLQGFQIALSSLDPKIGCE